MKFKVILNKLHSEQFLWNKNYDLGWFWVGQVPTFFHLFELKVTFFRKYDAFFSLPKNCAENILKKRFWNCVLFRVSWLELNCRVQGRENSKYKAQERAQHIFWAMEIIPVFFWEYTTFSYLSGLIELHLLSFSLNDRISSWVEWLTSCREKCTQTWEILFM